MLSDQMTCGVIGDELVLRIGPFAGAGGDRGSLSSAISADGRMVAFDSAATNLSADDVDPANDIFVRDLTAGTTTLVSRATGPVGAAGDRGSVDPSISADGRFVAFASIADNLSAEDADPIQDIFVRDLVTGTTTLVSRASGAAGPGGDGASLSPSISADGRWVTFTSAGGNLSPDDRDGVDDVFVRDLADNTTTLVSRAPGAAGAAGDDNSREPSVSSDGRHVAFSSAADNLSAEDDDAVTDIFVRDLSPATGPGQGPGPGGGPGPGPGAQGAGARCGGLRATLVGTAGRDLLRGTPRRDVIAALGGDDRVLGGGGNDVICLGAAPTGARVALGRTGSWVAPGATGSSAAPGAICSWAARGATCCSVAPAATGSWVAPGATGCGREARRLRAAGLAGVLACALAMPAPGWAAMPS